MSSIGKITSSMQRDISETLGVRVLTNPELELNRRVNFLVDYAKSVPGNRGFVLGISGGQDSSLAGRLAQLAVEKLRSEGRDAEFIAVRLPYGEQHDEADAQLALSFIQPDKTVTVNIASGVDGISEALGQAMGHEVTDFHRGNIKARMRMIAQYAIAGEQKLLVIGTDHAAEAITGFFTKFGDGAADILPLSGLTKGQGAKLLQELEAPSRLWEKAPTADLLDDAPAQADEDSLGVSYADIDSYLLGEPVSLNVLNTLEARYVQTEHKRQPPVAP
jgi:NAD+ synthase